MKENYVDKYKELNFFVVGKPFSGAGLIARMMYGDWKGFKHIDMNYLIDDMYNDFQTINQHHGHMRMAVRSSVILKNAEYLYRSIGIPEFIAAQKMWEWQKLLDENCSPAKLKTVIWRSMCEFNPNWRKIYVRQRMIERPSYKYVFSHAMSKEELSFVKNPIIIWVDTTDISEYRHLYNSKQGIVKQDWNYREYKGFCNYCRDNATFVIYNNGSINELEYQLEDLRKAIGIERNTKSFAFYRKVK